MNRQDKIPAESGPRPEEEAARLREVLDELGTAEVRASSWLERNANHITGMPHSLALSELDMAVDPLRKFVLASRRLDSLLRALLDQVQTLREENADARRCVDCGAGKS